MSKTHSQRTLIFEGFHMVPSRATTEIQLRGEFANAGCSVSPPNMSLAHLASTASPLISLKLLPKTPSHLRSQDFRSKVCLQVVAFGYTLAPSRVAGAVAVSRLRRYHQMEAANGWLQRNSGRSEEGLVSQPKVEGELEPLYHEFQLFWSVRRSGAYDRQLLTAATTLIWCCTPSGILI